MKKIILMLLFLPFYLWADDGFSDDICGYKMNDITFPIGDNGDVKPKAACLMGKNITNKISEGGDITSATFNKVADVFYYTVYKGTIKGYDHVLVMSIYYKGGKIVLNKLFDSDSAPHAKRPEDEVTGLTVRWYDDTNSTLYLSANAWMTSNSIRAMKFSDNYSNEILSNSFFTDGDIHYITEKGLSISQIGHDSKGAFFPAFLYGRDGKLICQLDTRESLWAIEQPCLKN